MSAIATFGSPVLLLFLPYNIQQLFAEGEVNIYVYSMRRSPGEYSLLFISLIFRGEYQELQNNGVKHKSTDAIFCVHARMQP